jgi:hypothetical protein
VLRLGRPLFLLKSLVESAVTWPREMLNHGAYVLSSPADLLRVLPTEGIRDAFSF